MPYSMICSVPIQLAEIQAGGRAGSLLVAGVNQPALVPYCSAGWIQVEHVPPFDSSQIDPSVVVALFGGGFLLYLTPWAAAYGFSALLKLIR